jgi:hypothetical protein
MLSPFDFGKLVDAETEKWPRWCGRRTSSHSEVTATPPGVYDASLKDTSGRACLVRNIKIEAGEIFSIEEKDLTSCQP